MRLNSNGNFQLQGINLAVYSKSLHTVETVLLWENPIFMYRELYKIAAIFLYVSFYKVFLPAELLLACPAGLMLLKCQKPQKYRALASTWLRGQQCQIRTELAHLLGPVQDTAIYQSWKAQGCGYLSDNSLLLQDLQDHTARTLCEALGPGTPGCQSWPTYSPAYLSEGRQATGLVAQQDPRGQILGGSISKISTDP